MEDTERRLSAWRCSKTVLSEQDAHCLLREFAEQKRKERDKDPEVKCVKNKYKLKAPTYPSPGNVLHTGRQLPRTPGPGVLPLLPSQQFEPRTDEDGLSFSSCAGKTADNIVPCGRQLDRTPTHGNVLREIQGNVDKGETTKSHQEESNVKICEEITRRKIHDEKLSRIPKTVADQENPSCGDGVMTAQKMKEEAERRLSAWRCSKTVLSEQDAHCLLREFAEQKRKERDKDPEVKCVKNKYKLKAPTYPSPGNVLHTGRQLPRTPGPGVLPLLPSQQFEPRTDEDGLSFSSCAVKTADNIVPCGRQLDRTPTHGNVLREIQGNVDKGETTKSHQEESNVKICEEITRRKIHDENCEDTGIPQTAPDMENPSCGDGAMPAQKELESEGTEACNRPMRRISEMPVQGLNQIRLSGVIKKMAGYECRNEDLEFLRHMENQENAKVLKKEVLSLRKDLTATSQEKELVLAKKEKIEDDIEKMKRSYERTVRLGRALLSRAGDPATVRDLSSDDVLKQLNSVTIQTVHQQTRLQLAAAEKELAKRRRETADRTIVAENQRRSLTLKVEVSEQNVREAQQRIQKLKEEVITLKSQIKHTKEMKAELETSVQKKRQQISYCLKRTKQNIEMSEEEREKVKRRLQRILHRKDNYVERERILQRLKADLL